jgi:polyisoprenoid-binding protein YceI
MTTTTTKTQDVGIGTWHADPDHSAVRWSVTHMGIARKGGTFGEFDARLDVTEDGAKLTGEAKTASVQSGNGQLDGHLRSPDFLDADAHPTIHFEAEGFQLDDTFDVEGEIEIKGSRRPVRLSGRVGGVIDDPYGNERIGLSLTGTINRHDFGVSWQMPLPGGGLVVSDDVQLTAELELIRS